MDNKFHDLRHTFAVRRYLMTRDIYQVMKEMGHTKVTTTQIYADFQISRLEFDFPSILYAPNQAVFGNGDTKLWDTNRVYLS